MSDRTGWIVCVACVVNIFSRSGVVFGFGSFIAELKQLYHSPMAELDWIAVMTVSLSGLLSPLATFVINKIGKKGYAISSFMGTLVLAGSCFASSFVNQVSWLFLTFSFLTGLGSSLTILPCTLIVHEFFPSDHRFHMSATTAYQYAYPLGIMTFSPLFAWIIQITSWRTAFVIAGVMMLVLGTISSLVLLLNKTLPGPPDAQIVNNATKELEGNSENEEQSHANNYMDSNWRDICRTPKRFCWLFGILMTFAIQMVPIFNLTHYMGSKNYTKLESTIPIVLCTFFQIPTLLVFSVIGHYYIKDKLIFTNIVSCLAVGLLFVVWSLVDPSYAIILVFSSVMGVAAILSFGFINPASMENMSMNINISWTATCTFSGIGTLLSPLLSGAIYDFRQSYDDVFLAVGISSFINGLIFIIIPVIDICKKKKGNYNTLE